MKIKKMLFATAITSISILSSLAFAWEPPSTHWSLNGINRELVVTNDLDSAHYFIVETNKHIVVGGDVLVTANSVTLTCDDIHGVITKQITAGGTAACNLKAHGQAKITMIGGLRHDWGAEGVYMWALA